MVQNSNDQLADDIKAYINEIVDEFHAGRLKKIQELTLVRDL